MLKKMFKRLKKMESKLIFAMAFLCLAHFRLAASEKAETRCLDQTQNGGREDEKSMETGYIDESLNELDQVNSLTSRILSKA